jgi:cysteine desulfurase
MANKIRRIYLDYASTTPTDPAVLKAMLPYLKTSFHNPSSLYTEGVGAKKEVEKSRKACAEILSAHADEIIFTGSGTEANNLALLGFLAQFESKKQKFHFVTSVIEHASILEVFGEIEKRGHEVTYIGVGEKGIVDPKEVKKALKENTILVSIMFANNEIGTIQPIREIAKIVRHFRKENNSPIVFHTDVSQAANYLDLNVELLGVDLLTLDSSKIYGTKGVGMLYKKRRVNLSPIIFGGGQEKGLRAGTENVAGIVGFKEALQIANKIKEKESKRLTSLREYGIKKILSAFPDSSLNGDEFKRLPNNINICFPHIEAEFAVLQLDAKGISCSSVTSCKSLSFDSSSYVVEALGKKECATRSLRFSLGRYSTKSDLDYLLKALKMLK